MYERLKVPLSFTWEIYGDSKADFHDCFRMFNPLERGQVISLPACPEKSACAL